MLAVINFVQGFHLPYQIVLYFQFACNKHMLIPSGGEYFKRKVQTRHYVACLCGEGSILNDVIEIDNIGSKRV